MGHLAVGEVPALRPRHLRGLAFASLALALLAAGCGVRTRDELVGRYVRRGSGGAESWELREDGTCEVRRAGRLDGTCEWLYVEETLKRKVVVTLHRDPALHGGTLQSVRYFLTPSRWPRQHVTLPITPDEVLEKQ
jgi:hypothetical protein